MAAIGGTLRRYAGSAFADRMYVSLKLRLDPLVAHLSGIEVPLGRVLDVGCGRGQFSLLLRELGLTTDVTGFDWDERKVRQAQSAARSDAAFTVADVATAKLPAADTLLLFDVLHYLPVGQQRELLDRAADSVTEGGSLLIRELDRREGWASSLGQWLERRATRSGYNRARQLSFRPIQELTAELQARGFHCEVCRSRNMPWSAANVLLIATRPKGGLTKMCGGVEHAEQRAD
jgi:SAM-dependent methyltransferase